MGSAAEIIARLKLAIGVERDSDLVSTLGAKASTVSSWRGRDSVPPGVLSRVAKDYGVSLDWLQFGVGEMRIEQERPPIYKVTGEESSANDAVAAAAQTDGLLIVGAKPQRPLSVAGPPGDARLEAVLAWWRHFWETSDEEERVWALVQLKRAIPEADGWIRRWIHERDAGQ